MAVLFAWNTQPAFAAQRLSTRSRIPNGHQEKISIAQQFVDFARGAGSAVALKV
jgi:hypothetical protein